MRVFVINLERSSERREAMLERLAGTGLQAEFFNAVEGRTVGRQAYPEAWQMSDSELGCYLSHVAVWRQLALDGDGPALVLEDDVSLASDLLQLCEQLAGLPLVPDMIRLSSVKTPQGIELLPLSSHRRLLLPNVHPSGTQGYWLTPAGAARLVAALQQPCQTIDHALDRYWRHDLQVWLLDPPAVWETPGSITTIEQRSSRPRPGRLQRKLESWHRRIVVGRRARRLRRSLEAIAGSGGPAP